MEAATRKGPYGPCSLCLSYEAQEPESPAEGESSRLEFSCPLSMLSSPTPTESEVRLPSRRPAIMLLLLCWPLSAAGGLRMGRRGRSNLKG